MTIVSVVTGCSLMAVSMFLLDRATKTPHISWGYIYGMFVAIVASFCAWGYALLREWKREKQRDKRKERFEEEKKHWERDKTMFEEEMQTLKGIQPIISKGKGRFFNNNVENIF